MKAYYHSINTFGTVDGPGIRYLLFLAGCNLGCSFCHNPDTWVRTDKTISIEEIITEIKKYSVFYNKSGGGITISGGEPLLQADFVSELFKECKKLDIHTALDTGGFFAQPELDKVMPYTDLVMFSLKAVDEEVHRQLTGKDNALILQNLFYAASKTPLVLRYVVIPGVNDSENDLSKLAELIKKLPATVKIDLLPYHTMGKTKWQSLKIPYKLNRVPDASASDMQRVKKFFVDAGIKNDYVI
ncbi:MAG: pyruvate formate-lyase-activating protein [Acidaminococcaceae bacterium]